ncbi:hypothetical protein ACFL4W_03560 [Planctomycetota bacterium]
MRAGIVLALLICGLIVLVGFSGCTKQPQKSGKTPAPEKKTDQPEPAEPEAAEAPASSIPTAQPAAPAPAPAPANPIVCRMAARSALAPDAAKLAGEAYAAGVKSTGAAAAGGRTKVRQLYSFEDSQTYEIDGKPIPYLTKFADELEAVYVQDNGATDGKWCARITVPSGKSWGTMTIRDPKFIEKWSEYDYFAMDLFIDDDHPYTIVLELWDQNSTNYHTRCTFENVRTRKGKQTLMWPINRAKRNNKEGRDWGELEPIDKIAMDDLKSVKIFTTPRKDRRMQIWVDNLRLLQEDAAKPKMQVDLPASALAWDFGSPGACVPGFAAAGKDAVQSKGASQGGKGWPDLLSGTFMRAGNNETMTWSANIPDGKYLYLLCAGMILPDQYHNPHYKLQLNDTVLKDARPTFDEYDSPAYVHRFMWTQYSQRPHAIWHDYIDRMYPMHTGTVSVAGGNISLEAVNHFVSALILIPEEQADDFKRMQARLTARRIEMFERLAHIKAETAVPPSAGNPLTVFVPAFEDWLGPGTAPGKSIAETGGLKAAGAKGQNVFLRLGLRPATDLGECELQLAELKGAAGSIPASAFEGYLKNYRYGDRGAGEMALLPTLGFRGEAGITQSLWLWLTVPANTQAGTYTGKFSLRTTKAGDTVIPVSLEVYPFALRTDIPVSYGMYGGGEGKPKPPTGYWKGMADRYAWMKKAGFTGTALPAGGSAASVNAATGQVSMRFHDDGIETLLASGLGMRPEQYQMTTQLGIARGISRRLQPATDSAGAPVDKNPGIEFTHPDFKKCWLNAMRQWKEYLDGLNVPYAIEIVDEPREVPNPWNRNLKDTNTYGDWMGEVGFTTRFVTPMGDGSRETDYTSLADHADIISIHAGAGSKGQEAAAKAKGKALWFYNTSSDRFSWGFYPWARGVTGRWEWHWMWSDGPSAGGYPGRESYSPFSGQNGYTIPAPWSAGRGGFLFKTQMARIAAGCTDRAYIYTLEELIKAKSGSAAAQAGTALLEKIKKEVPPYPHNEAYHAAAHHAAEWRAAIAKAIIALR